MDVEAFIALMRMTESDDQVVANLAKMALRLAEGIREAETRAALAEAALEAERAKVTDLSKTEPVAPIDQSRRSLRPQKTRAMADASA